MAINAVRNAKHGAKCHFLAKCNPVLYLCQQNRMYTEPIISFEKNPSFSACIAGVLNESDVLRVKSGCFSQSPMGEISTFRKKQYLRRGLVYLFELAEMEYERSIDKYSQHFWLEHNSEIVGSMRVTPYPFELLGLCDYFREIGSIYHKHAEFSRFVVGSDNNLKISPRKLLASAFSYTVQQNFSGVVAVCRTPQKRLFERFGLFAMNQSAVILPERQDGAYWFVKGECNDVSYASLKQA